MATNITTVIKAAVVLFALSGLIYASFIYENKYIYLNPTVTVTADILSCVLDIGIMLSNTSTRQQLRVNRLTTNMATTEIVITHLLRKKQQQQQDDGCLKFLTKNIKLSSKSAANFKIVVSRFNDWQKQNFQWERIYP